MPDRMEAINRGLLPFGPLTIRQAFFAHYVEDHERASYEAIAISASNGKRNRHWRDHYLMDRHGDHEEHVVPLTHTHAEVGNGSYDANPLPRKGDR